MNLHEYQGKSILKSYGVAVQEGIVVDKVEDAVAAAKKLSEETGTSWFVVKAQIHAGGRGKGTVEETGSHGVVIAKGLDQVEEKVAGILGGHLTTLQTNGKGTMGKKWISLKGNIFISKICSNRLRTSILNLFD